MSIQFLSFKTSVSQLYKYTYKYITFLKLFSFYFIDLFLTGNSGEALWESEQD